MLALAAGAMPEEPRVPAGLPAELADVIAAPRAEVELGRRLFFDPVLSSDRTVACASCHDPEHGFADTERFSVGVAGRRTLRNAPALLNRALGRSFMWDGRVATLEEQVLLPIENELEMDLALERALERLECEGDWAASFAAAYGGPPTRARLAAALAAFVRGRLHGGSAVDRFRSGLQDALTPDERAGMWIFESRGGCWRCHTGVNFTDEGFHATGIGAADGEPEPGRFAVTGEPEDRGRFKTPTLRGLADTAPYMHDGSLASLEDVVEFYRQGGRPHSNPDPDLVALDLRERDAEHLVAFLRALSRR